MILVIDNYDSFVFNLSRYIEELNQSVLVVRNDKLTINDIHALSPSHIVISPGPGAPKDAGISIDIVKTYAGTIPILGICLGHQVIGEVFHGRIVRAIKPMHGKSCEIAHNGQGIFSGIPSPLKVGRYHSLIVSDEALDQALQVTSRSREGEIMSFSCPKRKVVGLQFHPESVLTDHGHALMHNFITGII